MTPELAEAIGLIVDDLENTLYGTRLKLTPDQHIQCMMTSIRSARDKLATIVRQTTHDDPWKDNPLDG
jgi:hypothetical protein